MWNNRTSANVWTRTAHWRHGAVVDDGQAGSDLPQRRRLRDSPRCDLWTRWRGQRRHCGALPLERAYISTKAARRLRQIRLRHTPDRPSDPKKTLHATKKFDDAALDVFKGLGINLIPVDVPDVPYDPMRIILNAEAAASFEDLTRSDRDKELVQQGKFEWPNSFRTSRFSPAVDYVNANRLRSIAIQKWDDLMRTGDVIVTPTGGANLSQLVATNLTGHPAVIVANGVRDDRIPVSP